MPPKSSKQHITMNEALRTAPRLRVADDPVVTVDKQEVARVDSAWSRPGGWRNEVTGAGTERDKGTYTRFGSYYVLGDEELSMLYHGDDLAARMVDIVPDEMLREGFNVDFGDPDLNAEVAEQLDALGIVDKLADGIRWGRLFGGGALLLGCDDGRSAATPLVPERANALSYLYVFDKRYLYPLTWYRDAGNPKMGQPETYMVSSTASYSNEPVSIVHESRLVLFGGATTGIRERTVNFGWDFSVLQRPNKILGEFNVGWAAVSSLLQDGNQAVFKMAGLADAIASGQEAAMLARMRAIDIGRSVMQALVIDAGGNAEDQTEESFERQVFPMTGIPETLDRLMLRLSAALQIPVTILMGQSPAGMNATGQSDFQWFYDRIKAQQKLKLAGKIRRIAKVMLATKEFGRFGTKAPKKIDTKFPPLWTEPPLTRAQTRKTTLEGDQIAVTIGSVTPDEQALSRFREDGFEQEIQLSDAAKKAREEGLKIDLADIAKGSYQEPAPDAGGFGGGGGGFPKKTGAPAADDDTDPPEPKPKEEP